MSYPTMTLGSAQGAATAATTSNRPLVLNEGQMIHGQIKQLFPGQMAEVQVGNQKIYAKLEVPMKAGDSYYFQVNSVKPELQLKIISGPIGASEGQVRQLAGLMDAMQLPKTTGMQDLLSFVIKNKIPMSREGLLQAEALLMSVPASARVEALTTIQKIAELKLPFNESVFRSLFGVESKEGLHTVLTSLRQALTSDLTVLPQKKEAIFSVLDKMAKPFAQATGAALVGQSLLTMLNNSESPEARFVTLQLLKNAEMLPERTSLANLPQVLASLLTEGTTIGRPVTTQQPAMQEIMTLLRQMSSGPQASLNAHVNQLKALITSEPSLSNGNKEVLTSLIDRAISLPQSTDATNKFIRDFVQAFLRISAENTVATPFSTGSITGGAKEQLLTLLGQQTQPEVAGKLSALVRNVERSDNPVLQKLLLSAETAVASAVDGKAVKDAIQMVFRSFGLNYEADLLSRDVNMGRLAETLKPQLLALIQDPLVSQAMKNSSEMVVTRMNGPLLASAETGVQHQLIMQVPLDFFGKRIDATLQWNGRMKEDGKIDSDFARILFYLDLHSLDKTIIDMQVQNRVVSVTIYNAEADLKTMGLPMQLALRDGLEAAGYQLSGVFFKNFHEEEKVVDRPKRRANTSEQGVDLRI